MIPFQCCFEQRWKIILPHPLGPVCKGTVGTPDQKIDPPGGSGIGQKPEDVEFPTHSTVKNCTIFWEAVLLPKLRTNLQEI